MKCEQAVINNLQNILYNSGKYIEQEGLYDQCLMNANLKYLVAQLIVVSKPAFWGLCLPTICPNSMIQANLQNFLSTLKPPIIVNRLLEDPQNLNKQFSALFYITIILLLLFTISSIVATFIPKNCNSSKLIQIVSVWNLRQSMKIFQRRKSDLNIFNGFKSISMFWVIIGHEFSVRLANNKNAVTIQKHIQSPFYLWIFGAFLAVDVFFAIGGFLLAYSFFRQKSKSVLKYPMAILHRLLRFWPSYIMAILIFYSIFMHLDSGPLWYKSQAAGQINECSNMWKPLLFVDNLVDDGKKMCLGWGWYLQNDMQIFILSIIYLFVYVKSKSAGYILIWITIAVSLAINIYQTQINQYKQVLRLIDFIKWNKYFPEIYIKPWIRCPPYLIGMFLGLIYMDYLNSENNIIQANTNSLLTQNQFDNQSSLKVHFLSQLKQKLINNSILLYLFQIIGLGLMLFVIVIVRPLQLGVQWPQIAHSIYLSVGKCIFIAGLFILATPSLLGVPNFSLNLMDTELFNFIGKISFWTYLIHYMIVLKITYAQKVDFYYSTLDILPVYISIAIFSLLLGFIGTLIVEIPFSKLEKMLFAKLMKKPQVKGDAAKQSLLKENIDQKQTNK